MSVIKTPKKLIEVALPLDDINIASAKEKSIRHGHPSTLHLWWARRPLATARAVLFAQMVNDPGYDRSLKRGLRKDEAQKERERLFQIIRDFVKWENTNNDEVIERARVEIKKSWLETCELNKDHPQANELFNPNKLPSFYDPFSGGGTIPLEAQRLGLETWASDLNPVAVTISKAMVEIPPKFVNHPPVGSPSVEIKPDLFKKKWKGLEGLAYDVNFYGTWMCKEAFKRIGQLYPQVEITQQMTEQRLDLKPLIGKKFTVIAWIWARTVKSPNPAFSHVDVPLVTTFVISKRKGSEAYVLPVIKNDSYEFTLKLGESIDSCAQSGTSAGKRKAFTCLLSKVPIDYVYIRSEAKAGRMGMRLMAVVVEGEQGRMYLPPNKQIETIAHKAKPEWKPECEMPKKHRNFQPPGYGMNTLGEIFTPRQLVALTTFSDLVKEAINKCKEDANILGIKNGEHLDDGGIGATAYAEAVGTYLALCVGRCANYWSALTPWGGDFIVQTFGRQAIPMVWDFAEGNPFSTSTGNWLGALKWIEKTILYSLSAGEKGFVVQQDAQNQNIGMGKVISTDPPYYDNIAYADLSDFFYVWLRRSLKEIYPKIYTTLEVPKVEELVAMPYRHGSKEKAEIFFLEGMTQAIKNLAEQAHPAFPVTIYYAFKQSETDDKNITSNTGWETFLEAILRSGFAITCTWPMRTERDQGMKTGSNVLASCIILGCCKRAPNALTISRREFLRELNAALPEALIDMTCGGEHSPVAPVDLSQAIIGPGMAIFSQYKGVLEADGKPMTVRTALQLINRFLSEDDFDHDTQFCLHWFESFGWSEDKFGEADVLARAKGTTVDGARESGVIDSKSGKVRLLKYSEYPQDWNPVNDKRTPVWEALHHLIRALHSGGETVAGNILTLMITKSESIRQLAYRLYTLCERKGWSEDARAYNDLITSWQAIESASNEAEKKGHQADLFNTGDKDVTKTLA